MERYRWGKEKVRVRLDPEDLAKLCIDKEEFSEFSEQTKAALLGVVDLAREEFDLSGDLFVEVFPGKCDVILQIGPRVQEVLFYLKDTDRMLSVYPLAKKLGGRIWHRRDGGGYYLVAPSPWAALPFTEFAKASSLREKSVKRCCKRIL